MTLSWLIPLTRGRVGHRVYPYMYNPRQLFLICSLADQAMAASPGGCIVEAGCAYGATTVFLNKYLSGTGAIQYHARCRGSTNKCPLERSSLWTTASRTVVSTARSKRIGNSARR